MLEIQRAFEILRGRQNLADAYFVDIKALDTHGLFVHLPYISHA